MDEDERFLRWLQEIANDAGNEGDHAMAGRMESLIKALCAPQYQVRHDIAGFLWADVPKSVYDGEENNKRQTVVVLK